MRAMLPLLSTHRLHFCQSLQMFIHSAFRRFDDRSIAGMLLLFLLHLPRYLLGDYGAEILGEYGWCSVGEGD